MANQDYQSVYRGTEMDERWGKAGTALQGVKINGAELEKDAAKKVNITLDKAAVGLGNVDNTSDANKPVSTAQRAAINAADKVAIFHYSSGSQRLDEQDVDLQSIFYSGKQIRIFVDGLYSLPLVFGDIEANFYFAGPVDDDQNARRQAVYVFENDGTFVSGDSYNAASKEDIADFAKKDGNYETLGAGYAKSLLGDAATLETIDFRPAGGGNDIGTGVEAIKAIRGNSVVVNQLINKASFPASATINGITFTNNGDGTITANGTATAQATFEVFPSAAFVRNGKVLLRGAYGASAYLYANVSSGQFSDNGDGVIASVNTTTLRIRIVVPQGSVLSNAVITPQLIDLTQMFGAGNEPSSLDDPRIKWIESLGYIPYTAEPFLLNYKGTGLKTIGVNGEEHTLALPITTITGKKDGAGASVTIFADGMKSAGSAFDYLYGDKLGGLTHAKKVIGVVDLGSLEWTREAITDPTSPYIGKYDFYGPIPDAKGVYGINGHTQICAELQNSSDLGWKEDKSIRFGNSSKNICVFINDYSDFSAAAFKAAMSGVMLYYELTIPEDYTLDQPINTITPVENGGTEENQPQGKDGSGYPLTTPLVATIAYSLNPQNLPKIYIGKESMDAILNAFKTAGIVASYTLTFNEATGKYECSITKA